MEGEEVPRWRQSVRTTIKEREKGRRARRWNASNGWFCVRYTVHKQTEDPQGWWLMRLPGPLPLPAMIYYWEL